LGLTDIEFSKDLLFAACDLHEGDRGEILSCYQKQLEIVWKYGSNLLLYYSLKRIQVLVVSK
jgi:hypothetical protein